MNEKINYVEFAAVDLEKTKNFFSNAFGWEFEDFGDDYAAFSSAGLDGGFYRASLKADAQGGSALVVLYSDNIVQTQERVEKTGGIISTPLFNFPGGCRFHFKEPSGNELAVWPDKVP